MGRISKDQLFMQIAKDVSQRSTCGRLQVGCIITDREKMQILSMGYNGNYAGGPNECDGHEPGKCGCLHAEINALIKNTFGTGKIMYITDAPCLSCAKAILNAGIEEVYYSRDYRVTDGLKLLSLKIKIIQI